MDPATFTLTSARAALGAREISALELTDFYLERIARYDARFHAFIHITRDLAREQAQHAEVELARGEGHGALHGIPIGLKDLFDVQGIPTTAGSKILRDNIAAHNAFVTTKLFANGAVLLGKTNMHEFAYGVTNENPHYGSTRNPWNVERITGGSSGGSAAAVAARLCLAALGSDTGGSIRIPAALCAVSGLKPTYGRVSTSGVIPLSWTNDHIGPLAQTAYDCALCLNAIAGYDPSDPACENMLTPDFTATLKDSLQGLRFAAPRGFFEQGVDAEVLRAVGDAVRVLTDLGAVQVDVEPSNAEEMYQLNRLTLRAEAPAYHRDWLGSRVEEYGKDVLARLQPARPVTTTEYVLARRRQLELKRALDQFFNDVDFFITPTTRISAPPLGENAVELAQHLTAFTAPFDVMGVPAISIPCGFTQDGLPIGLQIVGRAWNEAVVLQAAHQYQQATDWHLRMPPL